MECAAARSNVVKYSNVNANAPISSEMNTKRSTNKNIRFGRNEGQVARMNNTGHGSVIGQ